MPKIGCQVLYLEDARQLYIRKLRYDILEFNSHRIWVVNVCAKLDTDTLVFATCRGPWFSVALTNNIPHTKYDVSTLLHANAR